MSFAIFKKFLIGYKLEHKDANPELVIREEPVLGPPSPPQAFKAYNPNAYLIFDENMEVLGYLVGSQDDAIKAVEYFKSETNKEHYYRETRQFMKVG